MVDLGYPAATARIQAAALPGCSLSGARGAVCVLISCWTLGQAWVKTREQVAILTLRAECWPSWLSLWVPPPHSLPLLLLLLLLGLPVDVGILPYPSLFH